MALTLNEYANRFDMLSGRVHTGYLDITFDSSYAYDGESLAAGLAKLGFRKIHNIYAEPHDGYTFVPDISNEKLKVFAPAPPIIYEEAHTAVANSVTLDYPAAAILNVATTTTCERVVEPTATLADGECQLTAAMAAGVRTGITTFGATDAIYVTYITQAWREVWENRVASETQATATHVATLDYDACMIESCTTAGTDPLNKQSFIRQGDTAGDKECELDFVDSAATTLTFTAADVITSAITTYIKKPASGFLFDRFIEEEDATLSSGVSADTIPLHPILFHGTPGCLPDFTAANERDPHTAQMLIGDALGTGGEFYIDYMRRGGTGVIKTNDATSDAVSLTYVWGVPEEIITQPLEIPNATDLSALANVRVTVTGILKN